MLVKTDLGVRAGCRYGSDRGYAAAATNAAVAAGQSDAHSPAVTAASVSTLSSGSTKIVQVLVFIRVMSIARTGIDPSVKPRDDDGRHGENAPRVDKN